MLYINVLNGLDLHILGSGFRQFQSIYFHSKLWQAIRSFSNSFND